MSYDRRWLDDPHVGDHVGRAIWALGEVLSTAWVPALVEPCAAAARTLVGVARRRALAPHRGVHRARSRAARSRPARAGGAASCSSAASTLLEESYARSLRRGWLWFEDALTVRQRASATGVDRRRRRARPRGDVAAGLESLRWLGDECGLADGMLRLPGHRGRHVASRRPGAATSSRSMRRRSSRRSSRRSRSRAIRARRARASGVRMVPRPQPARAAAVRLRDRRLQRRPRRGGRQRQRGRRVDTRVPPCAARSRRGRAAASCVRARATPVARMTAARALRPERCESDPDRR